jgi:hypothetical protein
MHAFVWVCVFIYQVLRHFFGLVVLGVRNVCSTCSDGQLRFLSSPISFQSATIAWRSRYGHRSTKRHHFSVRWVLICSRCRGILFQRHVRNTHICPHTHGYTGVEPCCGLACALILSRHSFLPFVLVGPTRSLRMSPPGLVVPLSSRSPPNKAASTLHNVALPMQRCMWEVRGSFGLRHGWIDQEGCTLAKGKRGQGSTVMVRRHKQA